MKKNMKLLGLVLRDVFTSVFMLTVYKVLAGIIICWSLCVPSLMLLEQGYSKVPLLKSFLFSGDNTDIIVRVEEDGTIRYNNYTEIFEATYSSFGAVLLTAMGGGLVLILVFTPLIFLVGILIGLALLFVIGAGLWGFLTHIPSNYKRYKRELEERLGNG